MANWKDDAEAKRIYSWLTTYVDRTSDKEAQKTFRDSLERFGDRIAKVSNDEKN